MLNKTSLSTALGTEVPVSAAMLSALEKWVLMYGNVSPWLAGEGEVKSMNLAAVISSEIARSVTIEMTAEITGSSRAIFLGEQLERVIDGIRDTVEFGCAKGGIVFKPYVVGDHLAVDYVHADQFYPLDFDANGVITRAVFADNRKVGNSYYTRLETHTWQITTYEIVNVAFKSSSPNSLGQEVPLTSIEVWADLEESMTIANVTQPLFAYFRFPQANNIDDTSPLGVSCFSRAVDLIQQADEQWTNLLWEFDSGKRALYVDPLGFDQTDDGKPILPNRRLYRTLKQSGTIGAGDDLFEEWSPDFRESGLLAGLEAILKKIEYTCGLAFGTLSDPQSVDKTATEIKSSKQRTFATITDSQKELERTLNNLLYAMDVWTTLGSLAPLGSFEAVYGWDDSIVTDYDSRFSKDAQAMGLQVMGKVEFRMRNYGETEEVATEAIAGVMAEQPDEEDMFG